MLDFIGNQNNTTSSEGQPTTSISLQNLSTQTSHASYTPSGKTKHRGYSYCLKNNCRYCNKINKTGYLQSTTTGLTHKTMKKVSCRSSNLICAVTCKKCGLQYVGQTYLRIKDRFVGHFGDINKSNQDKTLGKHFSQYTHNGIEDVNITVLEFIKMPPKSPQAITIRHRVEKSWTHALRTLAPQGLNLENPKHYTSHVRN